MRLATLPPPVPTDLLMSRIGLDEAAITAAFAVKFQQATFLFAGLLADDLAQADGPVELVAVVDGSGDPRLWPVVVPGASERAGPAVRITVAPLGALHRFASSLTGIAVNSARVTPMPYRAAYALHAIYTGRVVSADPAIGNRMSSLPSHVLPLYMVRRSVQRLRRLAGVLRTTQAGRPYQAAYVKTLAQAILSARGHCNPHPSATFPLVWRVIFPLDAPGDQLVPDDWAWSRPAALLSALCDLAAGDPVLRNHGGLRDDDLPAGLTDD